MSRANVEIAKRVLDAFNRRCLDASNGADDLGLRMVPRHRGGSFQGRDGVERYFEELRETFEEIELVVREGRDLGDRVVLLMRIQGRGRGKRAPGVSEYRRVVVVPWERERGLGVDARSPLKPAVRRLLCQPRCQVSIASTTSSSTRPAA